MTFSRPAPSPRYRALMALYERMHTEGAKESGLTPENTFPGISLLPHIGRIKRLVAKTGARTILDYGAGKGLQYRPQKIIVDGRHVADGIAEYWDVDEVRCYDPGYAPHASLPQGKFDGVISTDVLEHCPEEDLPWIIDEILGFAGKFAYLNVACYPARKSLPNGENAHVTIHPPEWWHRIVRGRAASFPGLRWQLSASHRAGSTMKETLYSSTDAPVPPAENRDAIAVVEIGGRDGRFHVPNETTRWRVETLYTKEPVTIEWLRGMPEGAVFFDVGANVGMYTVFAALAKRANVVAFEPESQNYALLNANLQLNGITSHVLAICAGLSDQAGIERLYLSKPGAGGSCHSLGAEVGFDLAPRPAAFVQGSVALRLDDLVASGQVPVPQYVKIDVDGFEHKVIAGMEATLRNPLLRSLIVELNPALSEHRQARDRLVALGFAWDPAQVAAAARKSGPFKGVAEHVFRR